MNYKYLIIGGGMAADKAVRGIREKDTTGSIGIISKEPFPCYDRPPLSKALFFGAQEETIWRHTETENVTFHLEESATNLDPQKHTVTTNRATYTYEKLLLATGVSPKQLDCPNEGVVHLHTLQDYHKIQKLYDHGERFLIIGSGYIASEMAAALAMNGKKVIMAFPGEAIYHKKVPKNFATFLNAYFTEKGVLLKPKQTVTSVEKDDELFCVTLSSGEQLTVDGVIAGIGCTPNLDYASALKMDNGVLVDEYLCSSDPDIYAAGDIANFHYPLIDTRLRIEHEDAANTMGYLAGKNMAGASEPYTHLPYFYSEMFELGYEAVGLLGQSFEIVEDWEDECHKGTIYYCKDGVVKGAMLWGIWNETDKIRAMIKEGARPPLHIDTK